MNINFNRGDIFIFATDGVTEAFNEDGVEYGENLLSDCLITNSSKTAREICNALIENVKIFSGQQDQHDDITLVVVKIV